MTSREKTKGRGEARRVVLGIETATPAGGVALASTEGELLAHRWAIARTGYSRRLMQAIDGALGDIDQSKDDLAAIAVARGPGSFTGVRVGMMTAKTLALHLGLPLYTFETMGAAARRWPNPGALVCVLLDARRAEVYSAIYRHGDDGALAEVREPRVEAPETILAELSGASGKTDAAAIGAQEPVWFAGDWAVKNWERVASAMGERARQVPAHLALPAADQIALLGAAALREGKPPTPPLEAEPLYLRASDAERNLARKTAGR